jgi:hypothetical protein
VVFLSVYKVLVTLWLLDGSLQSLLFGIGLVDCSYED